MSRNNTFCICLLLSLTGHSLWGETWTVAAEKFSLVNVPSSYSYFSEVLPSLILNELPMPLFRSVEHSESLLRKKASLENSKIALIREQASLRSELDQVFFFVGTEEVKNKKKKDIETKIEKNEVAIKNIYANLLDIDADSKDTGPVESTVALWKNGSELYVRKTDITLAASLRADSVSFLLTGTVEDLAGYVLVSISAQTGVPGMDPIEASAAGTYDEIDLLANELADRLLALISNKQPVSIRLQINPPGSRIFVDNVLIDTEQPLILAEGQHTFRGYANGYRTSEWTGFIGKHSQFRVKIDLQPLTPVSISFTTIKPATLLLESAYYGSLDRQIPVAHFPAIGTVLFDESALWFVLDTSMLSGSQSSTALDAIVQPLNVDLKIPPVKTKVRIEKQRSLLYWSLAALYISLPVSMMTYGKTDMMRRAYIDGKLPQDDDSIREINTWITASTVTQAVSIGLGCNYLVQLIRYFIAAEQAVPRIVTNPSAESAHP